MIISFKKLREQGMSVIDIQVVLSSQGEYVSTRWIDVILKNHGREEPTFILTNDFESTAKQVITKYARMKVLKKSHNPIIMDAELFKSETKISWLNNYKLVFSIQNTT
ncbi:hypothetical protein HZA55_02470 [Candidatus Poribacteria bacterium]|nr:hypothetical protein [Candidatus Poribacteria bacterium]